MINELGFDQRVVLRYKEQEAKKAKQIMAVENEKLENEEFNKLTRKQRVQEYLLQLSQGVEFTKEDYTLVRITEAMKSLYPQLHSRFYFSIYQELNIDVHQYRKWLGLQK
jgi:hypothetical protein